VATIGAYIMPHLPDLADRVWFAIHCLPRDENGNPPTYTELEREYGLHHSTLSKIVLGKAQHHSYEIFRGIAIALRVSEHWLEFGGEGGPTPTGIVPPRPGMQWIRHGDLKGWEDAVGAALREPDQKVLPEQFLAGADLPVYRPVERVTPEVAIGAAIWAWETSTPAERTRYSTEVARRVAARTARESMRATHLRRPAAK
jgi:hypothetical protein